MCSEAGEILEAFRHLGQCEKNRLGKMMLSELKNLSDDKCMEFLNERFANHYKGCPRCSGTYIVKNGKNKNGKQRYKCNSCMKIFSSTTDSFLMYTKKSVKQWIKYMECMINGLSVRASAEIVKIHRNTSFHWRHKILSTLKSSLKEDLKGIVEIDEVLIDESFKGNHAKNKNFHLRREPRKRAIKRSMCTSGSKVRVLCCLDRTENIFSTVSGRLKPDWQRLIGMLKDRIESGSTICTNNNMAYKPLAVKLNLKLYKTRNIKEVKDEIYHIQNAHSFGMQLKRFIAGFHGVATKYLNFYIAWLKWLCLTKVKDSGFKVIDVFRLIMENGTRLRVCDLRLVRSIPAD